MMSSDKCLKIPAHLVKKRHGYSMDVGGSITKVVYTERTEEEILIHLATFSTENLAVALDFLKEKTKDYPEEEKVVMTGISCLKYRDVIQRQLGVTIEILLEFDCIVDSFKLLTTKFLMSEVVHQVSPRANEYARKVAFSMIGCQEYQYNELGTRQKPWKRTQWSGVSELDVVYPIILGVSGSASNILQVNEDGTYICLDVNTASGKQLTGLGSLLTGAKSYEELVELARHGDAAAVDVQGIHLKLPNQDDVYAKYPDDNTVFSFGQINGQSIANYKREDLAAAVVSAVVQGLAMAYHHWSMLLRTKQAFFCGGVTEYSEYVREQMAKYFECRRTGNALGLHTEYYFVKYGAHLGAIGSLLVNMNRNTDD